VAQVGGIWRNDGMGTGGKETGEGAGQDKEEYF
jgi:hypothetical protein